MTVPALSPPLAPARRIVLPSRSWALSIGSVLLGILVWHLGALLIEDPVMLPTPVATAEVLIRYLHSPYPANGETLIGHALVSLGRVLAGFAIGSAIGIAIGALMASFRSFHSMIDPFIEITRPLPPLAFVPVLIVWFGIGEAPKIILIAAGVVPVMAISTAAGLAGVPADMLNAARCLGASEWYAMLHVRIRAAMPQIITGMRLSVGLSWTSIVAVEMIAATSGLGFVILTAGQFLNTGLIFAGIAIIAALGLAIDAVLRRLQRHLDPTMRP
jgi:NitT/TauT family transport system permease protein/taurine transport system permease protein